MFFSSLPCEFDVAPLGCGDVGFGCVWAGVVACEAGAWPAVCDASDCAVKALGRRKYNQASNRKRTVPSGIFDSIGCPPARHLEEALIVSLADRTRNGIFLPDTIKTHYYEDKSYSEFDKSARVSQPQARANVAPRHTTLFAVRHR